MWTVRTYPVAGMFAHNISHCKNLLKWSYNRRSASAYITIQEYQWGDALQQNTNQWRRKSIYTQTMSRSLRGIYKTNENMMHATGEYCRYTWQLMVELYWKFKIMRRHVIHLFVHNLRFIRELYNINTLLRANVIHERFQCRSMYVKVTSITLSFLIL